jgi:hypothetical protein
MKLLKPTIITDGGPWAIHNMPCAVCGIKVAVLNLGAGHFEPCWECQRVGWEMRKRGRNEVSQKAGSDRCVQTKF